MKWAVAALAGALACGGASAPSFDSARDDTTDAGASLFANGDFAVAASADQAWLQSHPGDTDAELRLAAVRLYENRTEAAEPNGRPAHFLIDTGADVILEPAFDAMRIVLAGPAGSASQIFDESFAKLQSYPVPPYAIWTATWHIRNRPMGYYTGESSSVETHRYAVRLADGMENISDPSTNGKLPPALIVPEFLGPFAWRLRASVHLAPGGNGVVMAPDVAGLKTIAYVVAVAKPLYTFAVGPNGSPPIEDVGGREAYHLQLLPKDSPQVHNLRDLWIDVSTYDLLKAHFVGTYAPVPKAPLSATDVTVYFRGVLGSWVVSRALWNYDDPPIRYDFDVQNDEIGLPPSLPDWLFDQAAYRQHQLAGDPDYLGQVLEQLRKSGPGTQR
ncbi:MAG TPA: hypothetical protein VGG70_04925 [Candidatus Cybelea sp.]